MENAAPARAAFAESLRRLASQSRRYSSPSGRTHMPTLAGGSRGPRAASGPPTHVMTIFGPQRSPTGGTAGRSVVAETTYTAADLMAWYLLGTRHERERAAAADYEAHLFWHRTAEQVQTDRRVALRRLFRERAEAVANAMGRA